MPIGAALGIASVTGAVIQGTAAQSAAKTQANAETQAAQIQQQQEQQNLANLAPYNSIGQTAASDIAGTPNFNFAPTQAQLEQTPGYQFSLSQGLNATQNGFAAQGLGNSGNAMAGAANYAEGLAGTTYQNQFSNALNSYQTNLAKQQGLASLGENAAAQAGNLNTALAGNVGQTVVGAANASAAGTVGTAQALSGGLSGASNAYLLNQFLNNRAPGAGGIYTGGGSGTVSLPAATPGVGSFPYSTGTGTLA